MLVTSQGNSCWHYHPRKAKLQKSTFSTSNLVHSCTQPPSTYPTPTESSQGNNLEKFRHPSYLSLGLTTLPPCFSKYGLCIVLIHQRLTNQHKHRISGPKSAGVGQGAPISAVTHVIRIWGLLVYAYFHKGLLIVFMTYQTQPKSEVSGMPLPLFPKAVNWLLSLMCQYQAREVTICCWSALVFFIS